MHRTELSFVNDWQDIIAHFRKHWKISIPLKHGIGTMSNLAVVMLDKERMLVGRHQRGAMMIKKVEDIQTLYDNSNNDLNTAPADASGLANLLECLYSYRSEVPVILESHVESLMFIGGLKRHVYLMRDTIDYFDPCKGWWTRTPLYVAITGVGSWITPGSEILNQYSDEYIAEKTGLWHLSKEEQLVHVSALKALDVPKNRTQE